MITGTEFDRILDCYKSELKIDKYSLEEECTRQPDLYAKYTQLYAEAEREVGLAKMERNKVEARLDREIRQKHEIHGFPKPPTEVAIERWIKSHADWLVVQQNRIDAQYRFNILDGIRWALQHRKEALGHLVSLFLNHYYSDIPVKGAKEVRQEEADKRVDQQVDKLNEGNERIFRRRL